MTINQVGIPRCNQEMQNQGKLDPPVKPGDDDGRDLKWMRHAYHLTTRAIAMNEVPVAAIIVKNNELITESWNQPINRCDPSAHAEILALRTAGEKLQNYRLNGTTLYVTLEPCAMCAAAMVHARIERLVFGAFDPKAGAVTSVMQWLDHPSLNHHIQYQGGILGAECGAVLQQFFSKRRLCKE